MTNRFTPWDETGRRYRGEEFRFSDNQVDMKTVKAVLLYVELAMDLMRLMKRNGLKPEDLRD